jgi:WD40 repeat protein
MKSIIYLVCYGIIQIGLCFAAPPQERDDAVIAVLKCPDRVHTVAFSPDDHFLAAGIGWGEKGGVRIWSLPSRKLVADVTSSSGDDATVEAIAFSPDGRLFAMADWGGNVTIWNTNNWRIVKNVAKDQKDAQTLSFSHDGAGLLITRKNSLVLADVKTGAIQTIENRSEGEYVEARFAENTDQVVVSDDKHTRILDLKTRRPIKTWKVDNLFFGKLSEDNRFLVTGGGSMFGRKLLKIMDLKSDTTIANLEGFRDGLYGLAFSQSKITLAVSGGGYGSGGFVSVWETASGKELGYASYGDFPIQSLAYSHNDKLLAAASESDAVVLYDPAKLRGPEVKEQDYPLCGEVLREDRKTYIVPVTKVPHPMSVGDGLDFNWKLEIANREGIDPNTAAIILNSWALESGSQGDKVQIMHDSSVNTLADSSESIVFAQIQNPGWNLGFIAKLYSNGSYVVTDNPGKCVAVGSLDKLGTNFSAVKKRLTASGFLSLRQKPLTPGTDHYSTRFIAIVSGGVLEIRSDADDFESLLKGVQPKKREAFDLVYSKEEPFLKELVRLGPLSQIKQKSR